jgi:hypothetical protein
MCAWFASNLLLTAAGRILTWLQARCNGKAVRGFTLVAILMDPQEIFRRDDSGICDAVSASKQDEPLGTLRLMEEPPGAAVWHHRRLVLGNTSATVEAGLKLRCPFLLEGGLRSRAMQPKVKIFYHRPLAGVSRIRVRHSLRKS